MKNPFAKNQTELEKAIELAHQKLATETPGTKEYNNVVESIVMLYKIKDPKSETRVQFRDWIPVVGTISAVLVIVAFEAAGHTMTSKASAFVPKLKV